MKRKVRMKISKESLKENFKMAAFCCDLRSCYCFNAPPSLHSGAYLWFFFFFLCLFLYPSFFHLPSFAIRSPVLFFLIIDFCVSFFCSFSRIYMYYFSFHLFFFIFAFSYCLFLRYFLYFPFLLRPS